MNEHGLGRIPAPDVRDQKYLMRSVVAEPPTLPRYRHYKCGATLDQGPHPHCVGYAWAAWLAAAPLMTMDGPQPQIIYHAAQQADEWPGDAYSGTSVRAGAKVLVALGHVASYVWAFSAEDVATWLLSGHGSVVAGTAWTNGMMYPNDKGFIAPTGNLVGGHAYLITGHNRVSGVFRLLNSWSKAWGQNGRAWITGEHLDALIRDGGEAATAIEQAHTKG